jgi:hypothetical protein
MRMREDLDSIAVPQDQGTTVDEIIAAIEPSLQMQNAHAALVGDCVDAKHPTLTGRVRVAWQDSEGRTQSQWLACLQGLTVRKEDRVLMQHAANWPEPVVVGVVDGFAMRPEAQYLSGPQITLEKDEVVRIATRDGQPLLEICQDDAGPVVRLLHDDVNLDVKGRFRISARNIVLDAKQGGIVIKAQDDITVDGEMIKLN